MERFTEKFKDGRNILRKGITDIFHVGFGRFFVGEAVDRLSGYEDLEEECIKENMFCLRMLLKKWNEFMDDIKELYEYRELEKKGKLRKLPCAVGDTVYANSEELGILEYEVDSIVIDGTITYQCSSYSNPIGDCPSECLDEIEADITDFGKTVFFTRREARRKLKELSNKES